MNAGGQEQRTKPEGLENVLKVLERLPIVSSLKNDIVFLRDVLYRRRSARIVAVGRNGSGRSSVANALLGADALETRTGRDPVFNEGEWVDIDAAGARLRWLECSLGSVPSGARQERPDAVIFVLEADVSTQAADARCGEVREWLSGFPEADLPPLFVVLNKTDLLENPNEAYRENRSVSTQVARSKVRGALDRAGVKHKGLFTLGLGDESSGEKQLSALADAIVDAIPARTKMETARVLSPSEEGKRALAEQIVHACATLALTVGVTPIPLSDMFVIAPLQVAMVSSIAHISGRPWDRAAAGEWLASMGVVGGAGVGMRWGAQQLAKFVPGAGSIISGGVAGAGTSALGQSAIHYFLTLNPRRRLPA